MRRNIESFKRAMREENYRLNGSTGTPVLAEGQYRGAVTDLGVGNYRITFTEPFSRVPTVVSGVLTDDAHVRITTLTALLVEVQCVDLANAPKEADLMLHVMGADIVDEQ